MERRPEEVVGLDELELHLRGTGLAAGEITFAGLEALARSLQQLAMRVGRHLTGQEGAGRSSSLVDHATELRLRGTSAGSTVLNIAVGEVGVLAEVHALAETSTECDVVSPAARRPLVRLTPRTASRSAWSTAPIAPQRQAGVSVSGRLDLVDLRRSRFRIRDHAGNDIELDEVENASAAAPLVGELVTATGEATIGARGQTLALSGAIVEPSQQLGWAPPRLVDVVSRAAPPIDDGIAGIDYDEVSAFLALMRE